MIRYQYVTQMSPPAPFVQLTCHNSEAGLSSNLLPAQVDSAADRTVIPARLIAELKLASVRQIMVEGFGGELHLTNTYLVTLQVHEVQEVLAEVIAHANERFVLLGRDVLNGLRIVLDGPKQVVEIG